jgi:hypothetical protein
MQDSDGNLYAITGSCLAKHFSSKRLSRQRLHSVFTKAAPVDRFDLITLNFFVASYEKIEMPKNARYYEFLASTNMIMNECRMGELYLANPYDNFLLMCILTADPVATYAAVWEMSFKKDEK